MGRRRARPRHVVSRRTITILRFLGWRHSTARRAWVHRLGGGNHGPVFRVEDEFEPLGTPRAITQATRALSTEPLRKIPMRAEDGLDEVIDLPSQRDRSVEDPKPGFGLPRRRPGRPGSRRSA